MEKSIKFFGICVLISAILISVALMSNAFLSRYKYVEYKPGLIIFDSITGTYHSRSGKIIK